MGVTTMAPITPVRMTSTAVRVGMPPTASDTPSATGAVVDFGAERQDDGLGQAEGLREQYCGDDGHGGSRDEGQQDRRRQSADRGEIVIERHSERDRGRAEQEMDELRALEIAVIAGARKPEDRRDHADGHEHRVRQWRMIQ